MNGDDTYGGDSSGGDRLGDAPAGPPPLFPSGPPDQPQFPSGPPPMFPSDPPAVTIDDGTVIHRTGIGARVLAGAIGVVLLLGGVAFAALQYGGEGDPEDAVREFLDAVADEDVLGVLATLDPGERDAMLPPVRDLVAELQRLEVIDESFDLASVDGIDLQFDDLTFRTEPVHDDLVRVYVTGGTMRTSFDAQDVPIGAFLIDTFERFGIDRATAAGDRDEQVDPTDDMFLAVRHSRDGWNVSIGYTAAEAARIDAGAPIPDPSTYLAPIGAQSPEAALEGLVRAAIALDLPGAVARLSPNELGALQEYWTLASDDAELGDVDDLGMTVDLRRLDLHADIDGSRARVYVDGFDVGIRADGQSIDIVVAGGCVTLAGDLDGFEFPGFSPGEPICADDVEQAMGETDPLAGLDGLGLGDLGIDLPAFDPFNSADAAVIAERVDGSWYVAPIGTGLDAVVQGLRTLERSHLDAFVDLAGSFVTAFTGGFDGSVGGGFSPYPSESFDEFGGPIGDATYDPTYPDTETVATLLEILDELSFGDAAATTCMLAELQSNADADTLREIAAAHREGRVAPDSTWALLFRATTVCGV